MILSAPHLRLEDKRFIDNSYSYEQFLLQKY